MTSSSYILDYRPTPSPSSSPFLLSQNSLPFLVPFNVTPFFIVQCEVKALNVLEKIDPFAFDYFCTIIYEISQIFKIQYIRKINQDFIS